MARFAPPAQAVSRPTGDRLAISRVGFVPAVIAFKAVALAITGCNYRVVGRFDKTLWPSVSLLPVCVTYGAVVLNNYS